MRAIVRTPSSMLWWVMGGHAGDLLTCSAAELFSILRFELFKIFNRGRYT